MHRLCAQAGGRFDCVIRVFNIPGIHLFTRVSCRGRNLTLVNRPSPKILPLVVK
jgi:hypothetical protein